MTSLEDRLRRELQAESEQITPGSLGELRLPPKTERASGRFRRGGRSGWPAWSLPLAAAAAVAAVIAGTLVVVGALPGAPPVPASHPVYTRAPAYYAYTVQGNIYHYVKNGTEYSMSVPGRYLKVRETATGKLLASVSPPAPYNDFSVVTSDASGDTFVLAARRFWQRNAGPSPRLEARNPRTPLKFELLRISPGGHVRVSPLSLPVTLTPEQRPSIALSPEGTRLAVAYGGQTRPAVVAVITLATGQVRRWTMTRTSWVPELQSVGAWTAAGRTLAFTQVAIVGSMGLRGFSPPVTTQVRLLDTAAPGASLASGRPLVLHAPAGEWATGAPFLTPDGTALIVPTGQEPPRAMRRGTWSGALAVYSASTGALTRTAAPWVWHWPSPPGRGGQPRQTVAWSDAVGSQLVVLQPRRDLNVLGVLTGGRFTATPGAFLRQQPEGYAALQYTLRSASQLAW